jgi:hypothetical protein
MFTSGDGQAVSVMAVADGHGHPLHRFSDVGSRLACAVAIEAVRSEFASAALAVREGLQGWELWLAEDLPVTIHSGWLAAIRAHWEGVEGEHPQRQDDGISLAPGCAAAPTGRDRRAHGEFSPLFYGTTLGLVVMTPHWWGMTGLGDWDLLRLDREGTGRLISEEDPLEAPGESTFSLCMEGASEYFAERAALHALPTGDEGGEDFRLLLCTDGVRKSCHTLEDFIMLAHYLCAVVERNGGTDLVDPVVGTARLEPELDRITRQGSGDDVSVALGRWRWAGRSEG